MDKTRKCAKEALELSEAIEKLNLGLLGVKEMVRLFGVKRIEDEIDEFSGYCNIPADDVHVIRRVLADGIDFHKEGRYDDAKTAFSTAKTFVLTDALLAIREGRV